MQRNNCCLYSKQVKGNAKENPLVVSLLNNNTGQ